MRQMWRPGRIEVSRAADTGGSGGEDSEKIPQSTYKKWQESALSRGFADTPPPEPKGNKEKSARNQLARDQALVAIAGDFKPNDRKAFEAAVQKYGAKRLTSTREDAIEHVEDELDPSDDDAFLAAGEKVDERLRGTFKFPLPEPAKTSEVPAKQETVEPPAPLEAAKPLKEPNTPMPLPPGVTAETIFDTPAETRMTEEGSLKELVWLKPPKKKAATPLAKEKKPEQSHYERPADLPEGIEEELGVNSYGKAMRVIFPMDAPKHRVMKELKPGDYERLRRKPGAPTHIPPPEPNQEPQPEEAPKPLKHARGTTEEEDIVRENAARAKISAGRKFEKKKEKKQRKDTTEAEPEVKETPEQLAERQRRVGDAAERFFKKVSQGASPTFMYQILEQALLKKDIPLLKQEIEKVYDLNGTTAEEMADIASLGGTIEDVSAVLGAVDGTVGRISYWSLPDGSAVVLDRTENEPFPMRIYEGGRHRFPLGWHVFENGAFRRMTDDEVNAIESQRQAADEAAAAAGFATTPQAFGAHQRAAHRERPRERQVQDHREAEVGRAEVRDDRREDPREHPGNLEKRKTVQDMTNVFLRDYRNKKDTHRAFTRAMQGASDRTIEKFIYQAGKWGPQYPHREVLTRIWNEERRNTGRTPRYERRDERDDRNDRERPNERDVRSFDERSDDFEDRVFEKGQNYERAYRAASRDLPGRALERFNNELRTIKDIDEQKLDDAIESARPQSGGQREGRERQERTERSERTRPRTEAEIDASIAALQERIRKLEES